ncbi:universal stress protein [Streptomyces chiangmaiensis]
MAGRPAASATADAGRRDRAEQTLERAVRSVGVAHPGLPVEDLLVSDSPVTVLLAAAEDSELLVLGSRGLGHAVGFVMGSVSQRVVARSPGAVVLVRAGEASADEHLPALDGVSPEEIPETPYRDVVLGMDTRHPCDELIAFAFDAARRRGTALRVVHALGAAGDNAAEGRSGAGHDTELLADEEDLMAAMLRPWAEKCPGVTVSETVTAARPSTELVRESAHASLVVVGRRTREARLGTHIGSVTQALLHQARCPVAVVPHA